WTGEAEHVLNITQDLRGRTPYTNYEFWEQATRGLPRLAAGPHSDRLPEGVGELDYESMQEHLRVARGYLYTGTQPASYTLGLLEALMTGLPVVSIGPSWMNVFPYGPDLFEGHEIVDRASYRWTDDPDDAHTYCRDLLRWGEQAAEVSARQRQLMIAEFGVHKV